jgi:hypothetical protein
VAPERFAECPDEASVDALITKAATKMRPELLVELTAEGLTMTPIVVERRPVVAPLPALPAQPAPRYKSRFHGGYGLLVPPGRAPRGTAAPWRCQMRTFSRVFLLVLGLLLGSAATSRAVVYEVSWVDVLFEPTYDHVDPRFLGGHPSGMVPVTVNGSIVWDSESRQMVAGILPPRLKLAGDSPGDNREASLETRSVSK